MRYFRGGSSCTVLIARGRRRLTTRGTLAKPGLACTACGEGIYTLGLLHMNVSTERNLPQIDRTRLPCLPSLTKRWTSTTCRQRSGPARRRGASLRHVRPRVLVPPGTGVLHRLDLLSAAPPTADIQCRLVAPPATVGQQGQPTPCTGPPTPRRVQPCSWTSTLRVMAGRLATTLARPTPVLCERLRGTRGAAQGAPHPQAPGPSLSFRATRPGLPTRFSSGRTARGSPIGWPAAARQRRTPWPSLTPPH
mmetsp:Transcript_7493/g.23955  ORF Transcript_7493/g.23955 Transcript_7493/m.23955 type:complete len:250 (+) Transcript_7493:122-871(+)